MTYDVAVVGAGIVGLAVAREVALGGGRVVVLDRDDPGGQASWAAAGMLSPQAEANASGPFLELLLRARDAFPDIVAALSDETGMDLGYRTQGALLLALSEEDEEELDQRYRWQREAGLEVARISGSEARQLEPSIADRVRMAIRFPGDHQIDNRFLTKALWYSASRAGAHIRTGDAVVQLRLGQTPELELEGGGRVEADRIVIAAGSWSGLIQGLPRPLPVEPVHGQLISLQAEPPLLRHIVGSPRGYVVPRADGRVIVGTTVERIGFRTRVTPAGLRQVSSVAMEIAPDLGSRPVTSQWSGLRPGTPDSLPVLGPDPADARLLYATGHFRNGILLGPLTGRIVGALALGASPDPDIEPFRIDRF